MNWVGSHWASMAASGAACLVVGFHAGRRWER